MTRRRHDTALEALHGARAARGQCRHCGGAVPCWSPFGDAEVGVSFVQKEAREQRRRRRAARKGQGEDA